MGFLFFDFKNQTQNELCGGKRTRWGGEENQGRPGGGGGGGGGKRTSNAERGVGEKRSPTREERSPTREEIADAGAGGRRDRRRGKRSPGGGAWERLTVNGRRRRRGSDLQQWVGFPHYSSLLGSIYCDFLRSVNRFHFLVIYKIFCFICWEKPKWFTVLDFFVKGIKLFFMPV